MTRTGTTRTGTTRSVDLDVIRAIALIGVCIMNYHGYLNPRIAGNPTTAMGELFDPWRGPLATRFASTFVVVAGMGVVLLTRRAVASNNPADIAAQRWVLIRRGVLLVSFGYVVDWVWPGTILFFYGGYFLVAAMVFTLRTQWIVTLGIGAAVAATAIRWWAIDHPLQWLLAGDAETTRSPRDLVFDLVVRGTHPLLPWLAFLCLGMVLQRHMPTRPARRLVLAIGGVAAVIAAYVASVALPGEEVLRATWPYSRSVPYVLSAGGSSLVAVLAIGALARATSGARVTRWLAVAGRCTLSLYALHVVAYRLVVDTLELADHDSGLTTALVLAVGFWLTAITAAAAWNRVASIGPLEWVYRRFSDGTPVALARDIDRR